MVDWEVVMRHLMNKAFITSSTVPLYSHMYLLNPDFIPGDAVHDIISLEGWDWRGFLIEIWR